jgi:hypothetical protein
MSESVRFVIKIKDPEFETRSAASPPSNNQNYEESRVNRAG